MCEIDERPSSCVDVKLPWRLPSDWRKCTGWMVVSGDVNGGDGDIVSKERCLELW